MGVEVVRWEMDGCGRVSDRAGGGRCSRRRGVGMCFGKRGGVGTKTKKFFLA